MGQAESKLSALNIELEAPPKPAGNYSPCVIVPPFLYLSGVTPKVKGELQYKGKVGAELTPDEGYQAARLCIINQLGTLKASLGDLDRVVRIVKVVGFIQHAPDFIQFPYVLNGASDLLAELFGDKGVHARSAIGASGLPGGAAVEVEMIVQIEP